MYYYHYENCLHLLIVLLRWIDTGPNIVALVVVVLSMPFQRDASFLAAFLLFVVESEEHG